MHLGDRTGYRLITISQTQAIGGGGLEVACQKILNLTSEKTAASWASELLTKLLSLNNWHGYTSR